MTDREFRLWLWSLHATFAAYMLASVVCCAVALITLVTGPLWLGVLGSVCGSGISFLLLSGLWIRPWQRENDV